MKVPHITIEQASVLHINVEPMLKLSNDLIDKHNAKTEQEQYIAAEKFITHHEARKMAFGSSEFYDPRSSIWSLYAPLGLLQFKFRRVKKNIDEQYITADEARKLGIGKAEWLGCGKWNLCGDTDMYSDRYFNGVKCMYRAIKQPEPEKSTNFEYDGHNNYSNTELVEPTCQVRNIDTGELKTITREAAKKLQAELGDTVEWLLNGFTKPSLGGFDFGAKGIYTYKLRAIKQPKQVSWANVPVGVAVVIKETSPRGFLRSTFSERVYVERDNKENCMIGLFEYHQSKIKLAPASDQPWIAVQDSIDCQELARELTAKGFTYVFCAMRYRITGIAEGWTL